MKGIEDIEDKLLWESVACPLPQALRRCGWVGLVEFPVYGAHFPNVACMLICFRLEFCPAQLEDGGAQGSFAPGMCLKLVCIGH